MIQEVYNVQICSVKTTTVKNWFHINKMTKVDTRTLLCWRFIGKGPCCVAGVRNEGPWWVAGVRNEGPWWVAGVRNDR